MNKKSIKALSMYASDQRRMEVLQKPRIKMTSWDTIDLEELEYEDDLVIAIDTPQHVVLAEQWVDNCWIGFEDKYGEGTANATGFQKYFVPRMEAIGRELGMKLMDWDFHASQESMDTWEGYEPENDYYRYPNGYSMFVFKKGEK